MLRNIAFFIIMIIIPSLSSAQSIGLAYHDIGIGRNYNLTYTQPLGKGWAWYGGLSWFSKPAMRDKEQHAYYKRFFPQKNSEYVGFRTGIEKILPINLAQGAALLAFYDLQLNHGHFIRYGTVAFIDANGNAQTRNESGFRGPITTMGSTLGLKARFQLKNNLSFMVQAGGGVDVFYRLPRHKINSQMIRSSEYELSRMFGVGLEYRLK